MEEILMKKCKYCQKNIVDDAQFCSYCGRSQYAVNNQEAGKYEQSTLILGITAMALVVLNYLGIPFLHLFAFVLGTIAILFAIRDRAEGSYSKLGLILSISSVILAIGAIVIGIVLS
jgi:predicted nucleic acid-binding Zn ribbon protein